MSDAVIFTQLPVPPYLRVLSAPKLLEHFEFAQHYEAVWLKTIREYIQQGSLEYTSHGDVQLLVRDPAGLVQSFFQQWICSMIMDPHTKVAGMVSAGLVTPEEITREAYSMQVDAGGGLRWAVPCYVNRQRSPFVDEVFTVVQFRLSRLGTVRPEEPVVETA